MSDPLSDDRFPDRPDHPDFWRLVSAVNYLDGEVTEGHRQAEELLSAYIDPTSLVYMAQQRVIRGIQVAQGASPDEVYAMVIALYTDAFVLGCQFTQEKEGARA